MAGWFRKGPSPFQTALAMIGAKAGDRVIVIGAGDPQLAAELARVTGLNGQTIVCDDRPDVRERVDEAAGNAGVLVDFSAAAHTALPAETATCDIAVLLTESAPVVPGGPAIIEALRVLRPGGRVVIIDGERRTGLRGALRGTRRPLPPGDVTGALERAGTRAWRQLADVDGVAYYEGRKAPS